jgi:hypothetical protein
MGDPSYFCPTIGDFHSWLPCLAVIPLQLHTSRRIKSPVAEGLPTLAVYPQAERGITLFEIALGGGQWLSTRYAPGYFAMMNDFAHD